MIACDVVDPEDITVDFSCIGGLDDVKTALQELVVLPLRVRLLSYVITPGVLLFNERQG